MCINELEKEKVCASACGWVCLQRFMLSSEHEETFLPYLSKNTHKQTLKHTHTYYMSMLAQYDCFADPVFALIITFVAVLCSFVCLFSFLPRRLLSIFVCCLLVFFPRFVFFPLLRCTYCSSCCCRGLYEGVDWPVISVSLTSEVTWELFRLSLDVFLPGFYSPFFVLQIGSWFARNQTTRDFSGTDLLRGSKQQQKWREALLSGGVGVERGTERRKKTDTNNDGGDDRQWQVSCVFTGARDEHCILWSLLCCLPFIALSSPGHTLREVI